MCFHNMEILVFYALDLDLESLTCVPPAPLAGRNADPMGVIALNPKRRFRRKRLFGLRKAGSIFVLNRSMMNRSMKKRSMENWSMENQSKKMAELMVKGWSL